MFIELVLSRPKGREDSETLAIITIAIIQLVEVVRPIKSFQASWADLNLIQLTFSLSSLISPLLQMKNLTEIIPMSFLPHYFSSSLAATYNHWFSQ
jgi:hypothetical protein